MERSLYESPVEITSKLRERKASTALRFWSGILRRYPETAPPEAISSSWQNSVGEPSLAMRGAANCSNVSDKIIARVLDFSQSMNSRAPSRGSSPDMTRLMSASFTPRSASMPRR